MPRVVSGYRAMKCPTRRDTLTTGIAPYTRNEMQASVIYKPASWLDPLDWHQVFGNDHPVEIDLGCGKGGFLVWSAQTRPAHNFLGIERQLDRLHRVDKKL